MKIVQRWAAPALALLILLTPLAAAHAAVDRAVVHGFGEGAPGHIQAGTHFMDGSTESQLYYIDMVIGTSTTEQQLLDKANASITSFATTQGYTLTNGIIWPFLSPNQVNSLIASATSSLVTTPVVTSPGLSVQTSTGAVGTQISTTTNSYVMVAGQVSTTASIAGNAAGDLIVEVAPTNSATSTDWVEWGRIGNSQALSLAITLQSVQIVKGQVVAFVPKGWYVKVRSSGSGTVAYTLNTVKVISQ